MKPHSEQRKARLAAALRDNLRRRKAAIGAVRRRSESGKAAPRRQDGPEPATKSP